jgi:hypothetical protein
MRRSMVELEVAQPAIAGSTDPTDRPSWAMHREESHQ